MTDRELMQRAVEAMEYADACLKKQLTTKTKHEYAQDLLMTAGTALRERLARQEPTLNLDPTPISGWGRQSIGMEIPKPARQEQDMSKILTNKEWRQSVAEAFSGAVESTYKEMIEEAVRQEREACAKVCEEMTASWTQHLYNQGCIDCAKAIRSRT